MESTPNNSGITQFFSASGVVFSSQANAFLTQAYLSAAGNAYFNAIRFAEGIIIKEDVGQGHTYTFLNGLRIYHAESKTLLADRAFHCYIYSEGAVKEEIQLLLMDVLEKAVRNSGNSFDKSEAKRIINKVITEAYEKNQLSAASRHNLKLL